MYLPRIASYEAIQAAYLRQNTPYSDHLQLAHQLALAMVLNNRWNNTPDTRRFLRF